MSKMVFAIIIMGRKSVLTKYCYCPMEHFSYALELDYDGYIFFIIG